MVERFERGNAAKLSPFGAGSVARVCISPPKPLSSSADISPLWHDSAGTLVHFHFAHLQERPHWRHSLWPLLPGRWRDFLPSSGAPAAHRSLSRPVLGG